MSLLLTLRLPSRSIMFLIYSHLLFLSRQSRHLLQVGLTLTCQEVLVCYFLVWVLLLRMCLVSYQMQNNFLISCLEVVPPVIFPSPVPPLPHHLAPLFYMLLEGMSHSLVFFTGATLSPSVSALHPVCIINEFLIFLISNHELSLTF